MFKKSIQPLEVKDYVVHVVPAIAAVGPLKSVHRQKLNLALECAKTKL